MRVAPPPDLSEAPLGCPLLDYLQSCAEAFFLGLRVKRLPPVAAESIRCSSRPRRDSGGLQLHTGKAGAGAVRVRKEGVGEARVLFSPRSAWRRHGLGPAGTNVQRTWQVKRPLEGAGEPSCLTFAKARVCPGEPRACPTCPCGSLAAEMGPAESVLAQGSGWIGDLGTRAERSPRRG